MGYALKLICACTPIIQLRRTKLVHGPPPHQRAVVGLVGQHLLKVGLGEVGHRRHGLSQVAAHRGVALLLAGLRAGRWGRGWGG